ncbi:DNA translocase FtsK 4TM domain-containing protein [uncultured Sphingomonas sp.]|uniref:FtsK/SpoIIIE family DNA translocase n=1 Tax=uncultured Sphingomonas sp. TaxID=158754 RepID=UPI0035CA9B61
MASRAQLGRSGQGLWRETVRAGAVRSGALVAGVALFLLAVLAALALASYHPGDPAINTAGGGPARNLVGLPGAWFADLALTVFGPAVALLLPMVPIVALRLWKGLPPGEWLRMLRGSALGVALMATALATVSDASVLALPAGWGGVVGLGVTGAAQWATGFIGEPQAEWWALLAFGVLAGVAGALVWGRAVEIDWAELARRSRPRQRSKIAGAYDDALGDEPLELTRRPLADRAPKPDRPAPNNAISIAERGSSPAAMPAAPKRAPVDTNATFKLPSLDLLTPAPPAPKGAIDRPALERNARLLESVLDDFHVRGQITEVCPGPVVTMYELEPAPGIKASRVIQLADDIARNMSAISARVATIPGRTVIGIELPNPTREMVSLHELVGSQAFEDQAAQLPIILGKNIAGDPVVADLAPMPHLLVAGTTGSGKSVGLNAMILSLLYRLTPDQCRMIMIDPKMLELSAYDDIPHLLSPVVTDPAKAVRALKWAVEQMEDRYRQMSSVGVRSLASFNDKVRAAAVKGQPLGRRVQTGYDPDTGRPIYEEEKLEYDVLPQIVVIVDELADLMMTAGKEVEFLIQRLAQKARAAGIHLIMATQRPSVDVITGVIKANLPTRISFHVTSKIDSRTILGEQGAEQLLGKGDMLYMPGGRGVVRVHGPFVSDEEVHAVADFWRAQGSPDYISSVTEEPEESYQLEGAPTGEDSAEDQQYRAAIQLVCESRKASTSWLQRQLRIGYNSAARLIERMEKDGVVGRPDHVGRREVLRDAEGHAV